MKLCHTQHLATLESLLPTTETAVGGLRCLHVGRLLKFLWIRIQELAENPFSLVSDCGFPPLTRTENSVGSWRDVKDRRRGRKKQHGWNLADASCVFLSTAAKCGEHESTFSSAFTDLGPPLVVSATPMFPGHFTQLETFLWRRNGRKKRVRTAFPLKELQGCVAGRTPRSK